MTDPLFTAPRTLRGQLALDTDATAVYARPWTSLDSGALDYLARSIPDEGPGADALELDFDTEGDTP